MGVHNGKGYNLHKDRFNSRKKKEKMVSHRRQSVLGTASTATAITAKERGYGALFSFWAILTLASFSLFPTRCRSCITRLWLEKEEENLTAESQRRWNWMLPLYGYIQMRRHVRSWYFFILCIAALSLSPFPSLLFWNGRGKFYCYPLLTKRWQIGFRIASRFRRKKK